MQQKRNYNGWKRKKDESDGKEIICSKRLNHGDQPWTVYEENFLRNNIGTLAITDIYAHFNYRTQMSVNIKISRMRLPMKKGGMMKELVADNVMMRMMMLVHDPMEFKPDREFYKRVKIGQKRFWQLYRGEKNILECEIKRLATEWKIPLEDIFRSRQMKLEL